MNDSKKFKNKTNATLVTEAVDRILELSRRSGKPFEMFIRQNPVRQVEGTPVIRKWLTKKQCRRVYDKTSGHYAYCGCELRIEDTLSRCKVCGIFSTYRQNFSRQLPLL
jgi:hypothetical protein